MGNALIFQVFSKKDWSEKSASTKSIFESSCVLQRILL